MPEYPDAPVLPVLDLRDAVDPDKERSFRDALLEATVSTGFFYLRGHGLDADLQSRFLELARRLFALPESEKQAIAMLESPHFRGWTRLGGELTEDRTDWREQIDLGTERAAGIPTDDAPWNLLDGPNLWPENLPQLRETVAEWTSVLGDVARRLLHQWALALGQSHGVFDASFEQPSSLLKIVRYPGVDTDAGQGVGAHKDSGVLTLLYVEPGSAGLQVRRDDTWIDAPSLDDALVVNIGELLEVATDGLLRATVHRVVSPPANRTRLSIPFFYNPSLSARIPRLTLPPHLQERARGVSQDADNVLRDSYGANALKSRLRAHPDVAERHHPQLLARTRATSGA